jgi:hypothetical protein
VHELCSWRYRYLEGFYLCRLAEVDSLVAQFDVLPFFLGGAAVTGAESIGDSNGLDLV